MEPSAQVPPQNAKASTRDWPRTVTWTLLLVTLVNVLILDYVVGSSTGNREVKERLDAVEESVKRLSSQLALLPSEEATVSAKPSLISPTPIPTVAPQVIEKETIVEKVVQQAPAQQVKEFYVPLGSASFSTEHYYWKDTGAEAILDLSNYPGVKEVRFEATLSVESGHVEARLFNVSDGGALIDSTLVGHGPEPKLYRSGNVVLPSGNKTYRVQMRTSLNFVADLDNARIKILVD